MESKQRLLEPQLVQTGRADQFSRAYDIVVVFEELVHHFINSASCHHFGNGTDA